MSKVLILAATIVAVLGVGVGTADARTPTPNGYCGAYNMVRAWPGGGANVPDGGGMEHAMTVNTTNNTNGNDGMSTAVGNSAC
jgi:hypothetical protein